MVLLQASVGALNDLIDAPSDAGASPGSRSRQGWSAGDGAGDRGAGRGDRGAAGGPVRLGDGGPRARAARPRLRLGPVVQGHGLVMAPVRAGDPALSDVRLAGGGRLAAADLGGPAPDGDARRAALAVANAMVDVERDRAAGLASVAIRLGRERAALVNSGSSASVGPGGGDPRPRRPARPVGARGDRWGSGGARGWRLLRRDEPSIRERGWEAEAVGVALLPPAGSQPWRPQGSRRPHRRAGPDAMKPAPLAPASVRPGMLRASRCSGPSRSRSPA